MTRQIWAPWRLEYIGEAGSPGRMRVLRGGRRRARRRRASLVARGDHAFVLLNKFPYSSGHLMVASLRHIGELEELKPDEAAEIHVLTTRRSRPARVYGPDAFNVGWNLGQVAGGSISGHLHEHVVPRWAGDTNFMPVLADIKVVPEHLHRNARPPARGLALRPA